MYVCMYKQDLALNNPHQPIIIMFTHVYSQKIINFFKQSIAPHPSHYV